MKLPKDFIPMRAFADGRTWIAALLLVSAGIAANAQTANFDWATKVLNSRLITDAPGVKLAVDADGNTIIASSTSTVVSGLTRPGAFIAKLDKLGKVLWQKGTSIPYATQIETDLDGNIFLAGQGFSFWSDTPRNFFQEAGIATEGSGGGYLTKLSASGDVQWVRLHGGSPRVWVSAFTFDSGGNYYFAGGYFQKGVQFDGISLPAPQGDWRNHFLAKLDAAGQTLWAIAGEGLNGGSVSGISVDASGNVFVGGGNLAFIPDQPASMVKVSPEGKVLWGITPAEHPFLIKLAAGKDGSTFIGFSTDDSNVAISKYSPAGNLVWVRRSEGAVGVGPSNIAIDPEGNCLVGGTFISGGQSTSFKGSVSFGGVKLTTRSNFEAFAVKYSSNGDLKWAVQSFGQNPMTGGMLTRVSDTRPSGLALSPDGGVVMAGSFQGTVKFGEVSLLGNNYGSSLDPFVARLFEPISAPPTLSISRSGNNVQLRWEISAAQFGLESADGLTLPVNWIAVPVSPVVVDKQNAVTIEAGGSAKFYRLRKP